MSLAGPLSAILQVIAAFSIFVATYLALALSVIISVVIMELIMNRARVVRDYGARPARTSSLIFR